MGEHRIELWIRVLLLLCIGCAVGILLVILADSYSSISYPIPYPVLYTIFLILGIILIALILFKAALNRESKNINMRNAISSTRVRLMVERINRKPLGFDYRDYVINQLEEALNSGSGSPSDLFTRFRLILEHIEVYENDQYKLRFSDPAKKIITEWISEKDSQFKAGDVALRELFTSLSEYINGNSDDFVNVIKNKASKNKLIWIGHRTEAVVFTDMMLAGSFSVFNRCFSMNNGRKLGRYDESKTKHDPTFPIYNKLKPHCGK